MKPLVALYKCYRGGEWFDASLESVRRHVAGIVAVTTEQPWLGHRGTEGRQVARLPENCRAPLMTFRERHPWLPVTDVRLSGQVNSEDQYRIGLAMVKVLHGAAGVLIVDTDEVWDDASLLALKQAMAIDHKSAYFRTGVWSYLRSPLYRVTPQEASRVIVGLANPDVPIGDSRFSNVKGPFHDAAGSMHHMGYVRLDAEEIMSKLSNTTSQDQVACDLSWKQTVWDRLPSGTDLHPVRRVARLWQAAAQLQVADLPPEITGSEAFWACLSHHAGGPPRSALLDHNQTWRDASEADLIGVPTTVTNDHVVPLGPALRNKLSQDARIKLVPRLRMSFREVMQLAAHASDVPTGGRILEIGSGLGGSMAVMGACAAPNVGLIAVDPFEPYDEQNIDLVKDTTVGTVDEFYGTMKTVGVRSLLYQQSSKDMAETWPDGTHPFDLILVDGNHSCEHALFDLTTWWDRLKPGGTILLHDLSGRFPGVVRAAREFEAGVGLRFNLPLRSTLAWLTKPTQGG